MEGEGVGYINIAGVTVRDRDKKTDKRNGLYDTNEQVTDGKRRVTSYSRNFRL